MKKEYGKYNVIYMYVYTLFDISSSEKYMYIN